MVLLLLLPFYDRNPERRPGAAADRDDRAGPDGRRDGLPHLRGRQRRVADRDRPEGAAPQYEAGKLVAAQSGCLACHKFGDNGNGALGPKLTQIGARIPRNAILRSLEAGPGIMPSFQNLGRAEVQRARRLPRVLQ